MSIVSICMVLVTKKGCNCLKEKYLSICCKLGCSCGHKNTRATNYLKTLMSSVNFWVRASLYSLIRLGAKCVKIAAGRADVFVMWVV